MPCLPPRPLALGLSLVAKSVTSPCRLAWFPFAAFPAAVQRRHEELCACCPLCLALPPSAGGEHLVRAVRGRVVEPQLHGDLSGPENPGERAKSARLGRRENQRNSG